MADGVWRTIMGRRVYIEDGQSLSDAIMKSGKFGKETKSGKYTYEYVDEQNPEFAYENRAMVVMNENGKVVYKKYYHGDGDADTLRSNFEYNEEASIKQYSASVKHLKMIKNTEEHGNYYSTKYGKEMHKHAEVIKNKTGDVVKTIKIDKSDVSNSRYINLEIDTDKYDSLPSNYTIRVSDHKRPAYSSNGALGGYGHQYDYEVITDSFNNVKWDKVISDVVEDIMYLAMISTYEHFL